MIHFEPECLQDVAQGLGRGIVCAHYEALQRHTESS
jgi:hypothetical protein